MEQQWPWLPFLSELTKSFKSKLVNIVGNVLPVFYFWFSKPNKQRCLFDTINRRPARVKTIFKMQQKKIRALTTFFLLTGKLPLDFTIMVHNLTSSGWVHLSWHFKNKKCCQQGQVPKSTHRWRTGPLCSMGSIEALSGAGTGGCLVSPAAARLSIIHCRKLVSPWGN